MPIYVYQCENCKKEFELLQNRENDILKPDINEVCNCECGHWKPKRLISKANIKFTGTGFYQTDYKSKY